MNRKKANAMYSFMQILYFADLAAVACYASAYLLDRGYSNGQIGLFLGICNVLTIPIQLMVANTVQKTGLRLGSVVAGLFAIASVSALCLLIFPLEGLLFVTAYGIVTILVNALQVSVNSLYRGYHNQGIEINFARSRGMGSAAFSLSSLVVGQLLVRVSPRFLPAVFLIFSGGLAACILLFRAPNVKMEETASKKQERSSLLREYPHFTLFLVGIILLSSAHVFTETYLLQILQRIGGNSGDLGVALAVSAITELPAMLAYKPLTEKFGNRRLMIFAGWMWSLKSAAIILAPSVPVIYAAELLQFVSYAIYVPTAAKHLAHVIPETEYLRGQALAGSAFTVGGLIATLVGGQLIDVIGLRPALFAMQILSFAGVICFTISILQSLKAIPSVKK